MEHVLIVAQLAQERVDRGASCVLVLCGTDTLDEVAFALGLLWERDAPIVVSGALRALGIPGSDIAANCISAELFALDLASRGRGCLVVINDEVHAARYIRTTHPSNPAAFTSRSAGPVGSVIEGHVRHYAWPQRTAAISLAAGTRLAEVALLRFALGDDGRLVDAVANAGYRGAVVEGSGGGSVSPIWAERLGTLACTMPVVYASLTGSGSVLQRTYGGPGEEIDLVGRGRLPSGTLDALKARILLILLLSVGGLDIAVEFRSRSNMELHTAGRF